MLYFDATKKFPYQIFKGNLPLTSNTGIKSHPFITCIRKHFLNTSSFIFSSIMYLLISANTTLCSILYNSLVFPLFLHHKFILQFFFSALFNFETTSNHLFPALLYVKLGSKCTHKNSQWVETDLQIDSYDLPDAWCF